MQRREQLDFGRSLRFGQQPQLDVLTQVWQAPQSAGAAGPVKKESDSGTGGEGVTAGRPQGGWASERAISEWERGRESGGPAGSRCLLGEIACASQDRAGSGC